MGKLHLRRLRVQVLLWTILPLIIFLIAFSFTGIGSHQQSMQALVAEENLRLVGAVAAAISTRVDHYTTHLEMAAHTPALVHGLEELAVWRVEAGQADPPGLPAWASEAVADADATGSGATRIGVDRPAERIVWTVPLPDRQGWLVGAVPIAALKLEELMNVAHPNAVTTYALVDAAGQIVAHAGRALPEQEIGLWPGVGAALAGNAGVVIDQQSGGQDVVAHAPVAGAPWALVIREPLDELITPLFHYESLLPLIMTAAAIISFLTLFFGLRYIANPLRALTQQANRIGQGDFKAAAQPVGGLDEIEDLRVAIDAMATRLAENQTALQDYVRAVTNVQETERARLGRELHDETVQSLIALDHRAQRVQRDLDRNPERTRDQVADLRRMIADATQEVRRFSQALRPLYLDDVGLVPALETLALEAAAELQVAGSVRRIGEDKELALYRIAQESLNNVRRHARATTVRMALHFGLTGVTLAIGDDGIGFAVPVQYTTFTQDGHFGLMGIRERAQLIGGRFSIVSRSGEGTVLFVQLGYDEHVPMDELEWRRAGLAGWLTS